MVQLERWFHYLADVSAVTSKKMRRKSQVVQLESTFASYEMSWLKSFDETAICMKKLLLYTS